MMKSVKYLQLFIKIVIGCVFLCGVMTGCGIRDSAIEIPIGEIKDSGSDSRSGNPDDSGTTRNGRTDSDTADGEGADSAANSRTEDCPVIYVYVCGAVAYPGVVELPEGSRADEALQAAGGLAEDAQRDYVNLAARVEDGEKLYFPSITEAEELEAVKAAEEQGLVNINTADVAQLMTLPGIGESRAQDIISYRETYGDFEKKEDLQKVSGIKENVYAKLCDKIVVR